MNEIEITLAVDRIVDSQPELDGHANAIWLGFPGFHLAVHSPALTRTVGILVEVMMQNVAGLQRLGLF
jgi:hypothetical protein